MTSVSREHRHPGRGGVARPEIWHAGPRESEIRCSLRQPGGAEVAGRFERWRATFVVDLEQPSHCSVEVVIDAASLDTGEGERDRYARSEAFLDAVRFPEMRFRSSEIDPADGGRRLTITGDLTIRDVTHEVRVVVDHEGPEPFLAGASTIYFRGKGSIRRLDFGLRWREELEHSRLVAGDVVDIDLKVNVRRGAK